MLTTDRPPQTIAATQAGLKERPRVRGKFIWAGGEKLYVHGVTYGTFRPRDGYGFPAPETVASDFAAMAANGINAVRTYEPPPRWLLDLAAAHGLRMLIGLAWEQHVAFLFDRKLRHKIEEQIRTGVRACAGHPAVLAFAVGNEIPAGVVRWFGRRRIESFIRRLYDAAKSEDPQALVTYVNFPTTEYLQLDFLDFLCFNVYLESQERLTAYLARLQTIAGERPLLMGEVGLDSARNGIEAQARMLDVQIRTSFAAGCAGVFTFAWTDEWFRGGSEIEDWAFGLTDRQRRPKPALVAVRDAFADSPLSPDTAWPRISVVVCSYNGSRTIRDCLEGLAELQYPNFEVIVVDDGSKDSTASIASEFDVRLIRTENRGLSNARNTGMEAADGEIVAYTDDDARPDPHWLTYLAWTFLSTDHVAVGGPNIAPPGDGLIADCVANAPGGPVQVLFNDTTAEHIPGCNMAFRKEALQAIGGFDPRYRTAGDDVDVCWRLQERGWTLGFNAAAMVWHHRRNSVRTYWRQQQGYGRAEALLEEKWPEKYNSAGHTSWGGRLYGKGLTQVLAGLQGRVYQGVWGSAFYQSIYQPAPGLITSLPLMPEWFLLMAGLAVLAGIGALWTPLLIGSLTLLGLAGLAVVGQAILSASRAAFTSEGIARSQTQRLKLRALTGFMHLMQPIARLRGRIRHGLTLWRRRLKGPFVLPRPREVSTWSGTWRSVEARLAIVVNLLKLKEATVLSGGSFDAWDIEVRAGILGSARLRMMAEDHGTGIQRVRVNWWPRFSSLASGLLLLFTGLAAGAYVDGAHAAAIVLGGLGVLVLARTLQDAGIALGALGQAIGEVDQQ